MRRRIQDTGRSLAIGAVALYALNLLFPVIPMLALAVIHLKRYATASKLARVHLRQSLLGCVVATLVFLGLSAWMILGAGGLSASWLHIFIIYFLVIVPLLLVPAFFGLLKAMDEKPYQFPLIGRIVEFKA